MLGAESDKLPRTIRELHSHHGTVDYIGEAIVLAPQNILAKGIAFLLGAPKRAGIGPIRFQRVATVGEERWIRYFSTCTMTSTMKIAGGVLIETLGMSKLHFELVATDKMLQMRLTRMLFCGIPCPAWLRPRIVAEETETDHRFCFNVEARVLFAGRVVGYHGFLRPMKGDSPT